MATTISAVRDALAAAVDVVPGLAVHASWPGQITPPAAVIVRTSTQYGTEFNGGHTSRLAVNLYVNSTETVTAQDTIDAYLAPTGAGSVVAAVQVDTTLAGTVRSLIVEAVQEEGLVDVSGVQYLAASVPVVVVHE